MSESKTAHLALLLTVITLILAVIFWYYPWQARLGVTEEAAGPTTTLLGPDDSSPTSPDAVQVEAKADESAVEFDEQSATTTTQRSPSTAQQPVSTQAPPGSSVARTSPPGSPHSFSTVASSGEVVLSWAAPADTGGASLERYDLEKEGDGIRSLSATSLTWSGLANGATYRFRVRACNASGCGNWTDWSSATTPRPTSTTVRTTTTSTTIQQVPQVYYARSWEGGPSAFTQLRAGGSRFPVPADTNIAIRCRTLVDNDIASNNGWYFQLAHPGLEGLWGPATNYDSQPAGQGLSFRFSDTPELRSDIPMC